MTIFKSPSNDTGIYESAPDGWVEITQDELDLIIGSRSVSNAGTAAYKLAALDAANALTQRNLRETVMLMSEAFKQITGGAVNLTSIPGVAKVYEVEAQAAALRAQL